MLSMGYVVYSYIPMNTELPVSNEIRIIKTEKPEIQKEIEVKLNINVTEFPAHPKRINKPDIKQNDTASPLKVYDIDKENNKLRASSSIERIMKVENTIYYRVE